MIKDLVHYFFYFYTLLLFVRIALSWLPNLAHYQFTRYITFCTDPYLKLFQRLVPPIGGMFDLSPILGLFTLRLLESMLMRFL